MSPVLTKQLIRFGMVGAGNTVLTVAAYSGMLAVGIVAPLAAGIGFLLGAANGYRLNRAWTFASRLHGPSPWARYMAVQLMGAGLDALGVGIVVGGGHLPQLAAEVAILPPVTLLTFVLCRAWVFSPQRRVRSTTV